MHILFRYLGELDITDENSEELRSAFNILQVLTSSKSDKRDSNFIFDSDGFKLDINAVDSRGYNLLHTTALQGQIKTFEFVLKKLTKRQ